MVGFAGGFSQGLLNTTQVLGNQRIARDRNALLERQVENDEALQLRTMTQDAISQSLAQFDKIVKGADISGTPRDKLTAIKNTLLGPALSTARMAVRAGLPDQSEAIRQQFDSILAQPTAQQVAEREAADAAIKKLNEERAKNRATLEFKAQEVLLGLGPDERTAFIKNIEFATDPNTPPEQKKLALDQMNSAIQGNGFRFTVTPEGDVTVESGAGISKDVQATRGEIGKLTERDEAINNSIDTVDTISTLMENLPEQFGASGSITKLEETITGITSDLSSDVQARLGIGDGIGAAMDNLRSKIIELAGDDQELAALMDEELATADPVNSGTVDVLETTLKFQLLTALTGGRRPLKSEIAEVKELSSLRGLKSREQLQGRLAAIRRRLEQAKSSNQRQKERGVTGTATTPRKSVAPPTPDKANDDRLEEALDRIFKD